MSTTTEDWETDLARFRQTFSTEQLREIAHKGTGRTQELAQTVLDESESPVYAIQHPDGHFVRTSAGQVKRFSSAAGERLRVRP